MKEQIKTPEKTNSKEIANLSDAQFKTLVIRMLTELVEFGPKLDEKMKARHAKRNKGKCTGNQQRWEGHWDSNQRFGPEGINKQPEQNVETRIQKNEEA